VKPSQYFRAAASLSPALDSEEFCARSRRGCPRTLEVFLDVAFVHNSDLYCPTIFCTALPCGLIRSGRVCRRLIRDREFQIVFTRFA
jgi:hypothetical protein